MKIFSANFHEPVFPKILHHPSVSLMTHSSYEIFKMKHYMLWTKKPSKCNFSDLNALMKVHPIPHAIFETTRSGFIQILHHFSVSWKITPRYFCSSNLVYFGQKEPIEKKFSDFWVVRWKLTKFLMSYFKLQVSFSLNFVSLFSVMGDNSSVLFGWNFIWFGWWKISDFQLLTWNFTKFVLWYAPCVEST